MVESDFKQALMDGINDPDTSFTLSLVGMDGATPEDQVKRCASRVLAPYGTSKQH
jgi:hypothetical protein